MSTNLQIALLSISNLSEEDLMQLKKELEARLNKSTTKTKTKRIKKKNYLDEYKEKLNHFKL